MNMKCQWVDNSCLEPAVNKCTTWTLKYEENSVILCEAHTSSYMVDKMPHLKDIYDVNNGVKETNPSLDDQGPSVDIKPVLESPSNSAPSFFGPVITKIT